MVSLEIVASSILIKEIHKFVSFEGMCLYALSSKLCVKLSSHFLTHQNKSTIIPIRLNVFIEFFHLPVI